MGDILGLPEFWIGFAVGGIGVLLLAVGWLFLIGLADEADDIETAQIDGLGQSASFREGTTRSNLKQAPRNTAATSPSPLPHPRPWPGTTESGGPGAGHAPYLRTARSEMRSQLK